MSSFNRLSENNITNNRYDGVALWWSDGITISENKIIDNNNYGIAGRWASYITISGNNISNHFTGITLGNLTNSIIHRNTVMNSEGGIALYYSSSNNSLVGNTVSDNFYGISLAHSRSHNTLLGNNASLNKVQGIRIYSFSNNNTLVGNTASNNTWGIALDSSTSNNTLSGNTISSNSHYGIWLYYSENNTIIGNTVSLNNYAIWLSGSSNNKLFHNNLVNNSKQVYDVSWDEPWNPPSINVWDDGYPSGGSYWSDYEERYPDAKELDNSGIWDAPYNIDEKNQDNYPLIEPWTQLPKTINELKTKVEELGFEGQIENQGIVQSLIAKLNTAQKLVDKGKIEEAKTILAEDFISQVQNLSGIHVTPEAADVLTKSAEYIISQV